MCCNHLHVRIKLYNCKLLVAYGQKQRDIDGQVPPKIPRSKLTSIFFKCVPKLELSRTIQPDSKCRGWYFTNLNISIISFVLYRTIQLKGKIFRTKSTSPY